MKVEEQYLRWQEGLEGGCWEKRILGCCEHGQKYIIHIWKCQN
jgi:hypothetical protein